MKKTVSLYDFRTAFAFANREKQFSYDGLSILFDYFEQYEDDCGQEMELDVIAICCDYSEETPKAIAENYSIDLSECEDEDERTQAVREHLEDEGAFVGETDEGTFVYRNF